MLVINNLNKTYSTKSNETINALNNINLSFIKKEMIFIIGQSGSGKTTLLNMLGGLDIPTNGEIVVDNKILGKDLSLELYRQNYIGFVFQEYNLIDGLSVFDNIALVINASKEETINKVKEVLDKVELSGFEKRRINELSGGQKQRVAIARALAKECEILLCDEPTGNLDSKTSIEIFELLKKISKEKNVIIVSHNEELANKYSDRIIKISDGNIILDQVNNNQNNNDDLDKPIIQNHVTLRYKLKIGFHNLFLKKFKTVISFLLLFLSMFTLCAMQITLSYNSERNIVKTLGDTEDIIVMKNNNENSITNENPNSPLFNTLNKYVDSSNITNIYPTIYGNFFLGECNKEFYKKEALDNTNAYVTDYFIDIINNLNSDYSKLEYEKYEDLIGKEITYNDNVLFIIGGIIKTDYKEYYDESGNLRDKYNYRNEKDIASFNSHRVIIEYKLEYEYKAIYATSDSYNSINIQKPYMYYYDTDNTINIHSDINNKDLDYLSFEFSDNKKVVYLDNSGEVNSTVETGSKQKYKDIDDGIIISGDLYNAIFGVIIDWESFSSRYWDKYYFGEDETVYYKNNIKYLGKTINISIKNAFGDVILDIKNQKIVGIDLDSCNKRNDNDYYIIGKQKSLNITNQDLIEVYTQRISYKDIESKVKLLKNLRKENILVMGSESKIIYEQEETLRSFSYFFIGVSTILVILTIISILNLINSKINDNKKEIGILMGIGFDGKEIIFIYLFSIMFLTIVSIILNICLMYIGIAVINRLMQFSPFTNLVFFSVDIMTYITLLSTGIIIILFGLIPLLSFSKKKPIDIITK